MASAEGSANLDEKLGEAELGSKRLNLKQGRDSRLSFETQIPLQQTKSIQSINADLEVVGTTRSSHLDAETLAREVKELSFGDGANGTLPLGFGFETTSGRESFSCALHIVTRGETGLSSDGQIATERGSVRDLEAVEEAPLGLKGQLEQKKFSCDHSESSMEKIPQERTYFDALGTKLTQKKWDGSFYEGVGKTQQGHELNLGEEIVQSNDTLGCSVERAARGSLPSIPGLSIETDVGGVLMCSMHQKTPGKVQSLIPKGKIVEDSIEAFEGEPHLTSNEITAQSLSNDPPEKRKQSFEVALESCQGAKKCNFGQRPSGTTFNGAVETTGSLGPVEKPIETAWRAVEMVDTVTTFNGVVETTGSLGPVENPIETAWRAVEMVDTGTQLNPDLEAAYIASSVNGKTVRAFLGALEALSREKALELSGSQRRVSYDSPEKTPRGNMRNQSLHPDANNNIREAISHDIPLSCTVKPKRGVPCINANLEDGIADLEVTASTSGLDAGAREFTPLRLGFEALERDGTYAGLGVDTGARGVTPLSLGIATAGGVMEVLIPRSTPIPTKKVVVFSTFVDYQTEVQVQIFEGERLRTMDNKLLGTFEFSGIPAAPRGVARICVSFEIDARGILNVFVKDKSTGTRKQVTIVTAVGSLSKETIEEMIQDGEKNKLEDETYKRRIDAKSSLEAYTYQLRDWISDEVVCRNLDPNDKEKVDEAVESVINWLLYKSWLFHCYNQLDQAAEFDQRHVELKSICTPILESIYQRVTTPRST